MKIQKLFFLFFLFISFPFFAQIERFKDKKEQIKTMKVAFLTTELALTPNEAEKFWPIYNAFDEKQFDLRHQKMRAYMNRINDNSLDKMPEKEANTLLLQMEGTDEELFLIRKKFITNLRAILPAVKIIKLRKLEEDFNRKLLQQYRDKRLKR
jgi:hypothetical protein